MLLNNMGKGNIEDGVDVQKIKSKAEEKKDYDKNGMERDIAGVKVENWVGGKKGKKEGIDKAYV